MSRTYTQYLKSIPGEHERCKSGASESTIECNLSWFFPWILGLGIRSLVKFYCTQLTSSQVVCYFKLKLFHFEGSPGWYIFWGFSRVFPDPVGIYSQQTWGSATMRRKAVGVAGQHRGGCPAEHWSDLWRGLLELLGDGAEGWNMLVEGWILLVVHSISIYIYIICLIILWLLWYQISWIMTEIYRKCRIQPSTVGVSCV